MRLLLAILWHLNLSLFALETDLNFPETSLKVKSDRPNIILILVDDMGFSDPGCFGGEIETPNLDRLATNGFRASQFYNTPRCCPSRACLLTGLYPHEAGVGMMVYRDIAEVQVKRSFRILTRLVDVIQRDICKKISRMKFLIRRIGIAGSLF